MDGALAHREIADGEGQGAPCLNCGERLGGDYCHRCGQNAHVHRTAGALFHDISHSVFHFEGKIWRTLPMLCWRPGELTRRYIAGERARFLSPVAAFLFSVFLMFAVINTVGKTAYADRRAAEAAAAQTAPLGKSDGDLVAESVADAVGGLGWVDETWRRAKANPSLLGYKLSSNSYKFSWALIPISIPPVHMYRQLRGAYLLTRFGALWRTAMLVLFAIVAVLLFFMLLLVTGLLG